MRKLSVSVVSVLVALPMVAKADIADFAKFTPAQISENSKVAKTDYVKGAYNAVIDNINTVVHQVNTNTSDIADKQDVIDGSNKLNADYVDDTSSTNKFVTSAEKTAIGTISGKQSQLMNDDATLPVAISDTVLTTVGATGDDTHLVTEKAVRDAIDAATSNVVTTGSVQTAVTNAVNALDLPNTYQAKSDSNVVAGNNETLNYISAGTGVAANLKALDVRVKINSDVIGDMATNWVSPEDIEETQTEP